MPRSAVALTRKLSDVTVLVVNNITFLITHMTTIKTNLNRLPKTLTI